MKPPAFEYFNPRTLDEALDLLAQHGDEGKVLAGGQSLVPMLNFRLLSPSCLIDINRVEGLSGIRTGDGELIVGSVTRQRALERSEEARRLCPLIYDVMPNIAHFQIRNRGTIGGSLSNADPAAELPAVVIALNGRLVVRSVKAQRVVAAAEFFTGYLTTSLNADELVTEILLPGEPPFSGSAFLEVNRRHGDFALAGVAVCVTLNHGGECVGARIVLTGVAETPFQATEAASALIGSRLGESVLDEASRLVAKGVKPPSDIHASSEYRVQAAQVLTARALTKAVERAQASLAEAG